MRLWPFRRAPAPEAKYSAVGPNIARIYTGQAVWAPRSYEVFSREGYQQNAIAHAAIRLVAKSAASVPILLYDAMGQEVEAHVILDLLDRPSGMYSGAAFLEAVFAYLLISGNAYIEAVGPERGAPKELWPHRPDRMQVIAGRYGFPEGYRYTVNGLPKDWRADPLTGFGPILHLRDFNPLDDWYGMGRIEAAATAIDRHNAAAAHNKALLDNGARPSGALVFKPVKVGPDQVDSAPQSMIDAATEKLTTTHVGPEKAGKPLVFSGDVTWQDMGTSPKDMDFFEGMQDSARLICHAIGVPSMLLIPGENTYSNRAEANLELYERTVIPLVEMLLDGLNAWLCPRYGEGLRLGIDMDGISALEPRRESRRNSALELYNAGVIDLAEAREMLQYGKPGKDFEVKPDATLVAQLASATVLDAAGDGPLLDYLDRTGLGDAGAMRAAALAQFEDDDMGVQPPPRVDGETDDADEI